MTEAMPKLTKVEPIGPRRERMALYFDDVVASVVQALAESRLLDDTEFSTTFARSRMRGRPRAPRTILRELRARGVDADTAEDGLRGALREENASELSLALSAAETWLRRA